MEGSDRVERIVSVGCTVVVNQVDKLIVSCRGNRTAQDVFKSRALSIVWRVAKYVMWKISPSPNRTTDSNLLLSIIHDIGAKAGGRGAAGSDDLQVEKEILRLKEGETTKTGSANSKEEFLL